MMDTELAMPLWQASFSGVFALLYILSGYRTVRFTARLMSALLFGVVAMMASTRVEHGAVVAAIVIGAGLLGFLVGNAFYFVTVALYGAVGGVVLAALISMGLGHPVGWAAGIGGAVAGALLGIIFERPAVILGTSLAGGALAAKSLESVLASGNLADHHHRFGWAYALLTVALGVVGCVIQARTTRDLPPPPTKGASQPPPLKG